MTATTTSMPPTPGPQPARRDPADQPERPGTIPWELLGASDYRTALTDLGSWLAWLVPTYRIPPSVIPPCWFQHPGLIEELGHLWTGWRVTQHPDSGMGMVGLEWDGHRERATGRLREVVATAGCNGSSHSPKPAPVLNRDDKVWKASLRSEVALRTARSTDHAVRSAAKEILLQAEERPKLARDVLGASAIDPKNPTAAEIGQATIALENMAHAAAIAAHERGREARGHLERAERDARLHWELAAAREDLLIWIATDSPPDELAAPTIRWTAACTSAAPAEDAFRIAIAANIGRSTASTRLASWKFRHEGIGALLPPSADC